MKSRFTRACHVMTGFLLLGTAYADECNGIVVKAIPEDKIGGKVETSLELIHAYEGKPDGTPLSYGGHGGGIYPADHVKILNCSRRRIASEPYFELILDDTPKNASEILYQRITQKLVDAGLDYANGGNAARTYLTQPRKACSLMIKRALDGDAAAVEVIRKTGICLPR